MPHDSGAAATHEEGGVSSAPQRNLVLILARDFASRLATAVFLVDTDGNLIYYNEAAELVLGRPYVEGETMAAAEWSTAFNPVDEDGVPVPLESMPLGVAMLQGRPEHKHFWIVGEDTVRRAIEVTAFPLFTQAAEMVGAVAIFWEPEA
jgi:PAS domain-containing protein